ncbi:MAG: hypothetical protein IPK60_07730 [Sandaracinaceae bacterium]|nr:hypothetical protein [Sandaracinaceae bacterium]
MNPAAAIDAELKRLRAEGARWLEARVLNERALVMDELRPNARALASHLLERKPELLARMRMAPSDAGDGMDLRAIILSPTGDSLRDVLIFVANDDPSVAFGTWHTHFDFDAGRGATEAANLVDAILCDDFVMLALYDKDARATTHVCDLREEDALADALTSRYTTGEGRLLSWSGGADRDVSLATLKM